MPTAFRKSTASGHCSPPRSWRPLRWVLAPIASGALSEETYLRALAEWLGIVRESVED
jgi:hypothetical protein